MSRDAVCRKASVPGPAEDSVPACAESILQGPESLQWFPSNHPGFELFPDGFPDVCEVRVNKVSTKPLDIAGLRETQKRLQPYLTQAAKTWWETTLLKLEEQDGNSCATCRRLREEQNNCCASKKDDDETRKEKRRRKYHVDKEFLEHLQDSTFSVEHQEYPRSSLFPPSRFHWVNGGYVDLKEGPIVLNDEEMELRNNLHDQRQESETHFVGVSAKVNRAGTKNPRPPDIEPGHIVVVRSEDSECPFYVGEVMSCSNQQVSFPGGVRDSKITICEYGYRQAAGGRGQRQSDPAAVTWQAIFRGKEMVNGCLTERDEFRLDAGSKPTSRSYKPLTRTIWHSSVAEYDIPEKMLTKRSSKKGTAHRKLQSWVKQVLNLNPRVVWSHKRAHDQSAAGGNPKRRRMQ